MSDPRCKCTMSISMTGDGCRYCQPQEYIERMGEWLDEERDEITALHTENEKLQAMVSALVEALESIMDYIPLSVVRCHGDKCRELWCASCFDDEEAESYLDTAERHLKNAKTAITTYYKGEEV